MVTSTKILAVNQSRRSTGAVKTLSTKRFARGLARNAAASGMNASGTRKYAMTPYPSSQVSCVPAVATQPTVSRTTPAPSSAKRPRIAALSSSTYRVPIAMSLLNLDHAAARTYLANSSPNGHSIHYANINSLLNRPLTLLPTYGPTALTGQIHQEAPLETSTNWAFFAASKTPFYDN